MIFFLKKPTQNRFSTKQSSFYSLCYTQRPFQFTFAPFLTVKIMTFFCLLFLICLFIPIYFWHSLTKAGSSVQLSGSDCFVLLCKLSLHDTQFTDTLPLENERALKGFSVAARGIPLDHILNHYKILWSSSAGSHNLLY